MKIPGDLWHSNKQTIKTVKRQLFPKDKTQNNEKKMKILIVVNHQYTKYACLRVMWQL